MQDTVLPFDVQHIGFYQRKPIFRDIFVLAALAIQRVEANPCPRCFHVVPEHCSDVLAALAQSLQQLPSGAVAAAGGWHILAVFVLPCFCDIAHEIICFKQRFDILGKFLCWIPCFRLWNGNVLCFFSAGNHIIFPNGVIPVQGMRFFFGILGAVAVFQCQMHNRSGSDGMFAACKGSPFLFAFAIVITCSISL